MEVGVINNTRRSHWLYTRLPADKVGNVHFFAVFFPQRLFVSDLPAQFGIKTTVSGLRSYGY